MLEKRDILGSRIYSGKGMLWLALQREKAEKAIIGWTLSFKAHDC